MLQLIQKRNTGDKERRVQFVCPDLNIVDENNYFKEQVVFSDKTALKLSGEVIKHSVRIWSPKNKYAYTEDV